MDCHKLFGGPLYNQDFSDCDDVHTLNKGKEYSISIKTKNKKTRRIEISFVMMKDKNNQDFGLLACFRDITALLNIKPKFGEFPGFSNMIGRNSKMLALFRQIQDVARYDYPVYISGETGTGKELVAKAIHNESRRRDSAFIPINCSALPEGLIESEVFGHVKGAFSGAIRDKKGRFEMANNGTIFLDEVAELSMPLQVKLLRFFQDSIIEKVGGEKSISVNVRVISASNKNLKNEVTKGNFREDLFYRLNVIPINIPPLRERKSDIPIIIDHFLHKAVNKNQKKMILSDEAFSVLMNYSWPGNVRELQNAVMFSIVKSHGHVIKLNDLPMELVNFKKKSTGRGPHRKLDAATVQDALAGTDGNKAKAARNLGVGRATLYRFLKSR
jgi:transcriptional regulator with PAS, ATPase and Fis domain